MVIDGKKRNWGVHTYISTSTQLFLRATELTARHICGYKEQATSLYSASAYKVTN